MFLHRSSSSINSWNQTEEEDAREGREEKMKGEAPLLWQDEVDWREGKGRRRRKEEIVV